jgi:RNA polymerase sigma factor (sigma-70 family)
VEPKLREELSNLRPGREYSTQEECAEVFALEELTQFYTARRRNLLGQAFAIVRNHALAEEITQETFVRLVAEVKSGNTVRNVIHWTSKVLRNLALNHLEHGKVVSRFTEPDFQSYLEATSSIDISAEETYLAEESKARLHYVLSQLPLLERECTLMFAVGHSYNEIARKMELSDGVAVDVVRRSIRKLRKQLSVDFGT